MTELTRKEVAETLKISPKSLARLVKDPSCPLSAGRKSGGRMVWPKEEVEAARRWRSDKAAARKAGQPAALRKRAAPLAGSSSSEAAGPLSARAAEFKIPVVSVSEASQPGVRRRVETPFALTPQSFQKLAALGMRMALDPRSYDPRNALPMMMMGPMNPFWWLAAGAPNRAV